MLTHGQSQARTQQFVDHVVREDQNSFVQELRRLGHRALAIHGQIAPPSALGHPMWSPSPQEDGSNTSASAQSRCTMANDCPIASSIRDWRPQTWVEREYEVLLFPGRGG
jgi:hypothetical protein